MARKSWRIIPGSHQLVKPMRKQMCIRAEHQARVACGLFKPLPRPYRFSVFFPPFKSCMLLSCKVLTIFML